LLKDMADKYGLEPAKFSDTLMKTVMPREAKPEHLAAFLVVAKEYDLNPFTREIYAFASQAGGIVPIVGVDGWNTIINNHPQFDGLNFKEEENPDGSLKAVECIIHRKDRAHPTIIREHMSECARDTKPWKQWPRRMLRHKALIQCGRVAFGYSGIYDEDEGSEIAEAEVLGSTLGMTEEVKAASTTVAKEQHKQAKRPPKKPGREKKAPPQEDPVPKKGLEISIAEEEDPLGQYNEALEAATRKMIKNDPERDIREAAAQVEEQLLAHLKVKSPQELIDKGRLEQALKILNNQ